jgi:DNA damage-inducible protein 1
MKLNFNYNTKFFAADLPPSMTLADMAAYIEAETGLPPTHQNLMHKYIPLSPSKITTLEQSNIKENDMIVIIPFDPVNDNLTRAYEENPEFFADVSMLYIKVSLNGYELAAFIDTGAQRSLITPQICEKCDLNHLIDQRFKMQARGVGEKQSNGRIHSVPMVIGGSESCNISLTVLDVGGVALLIGLDWMKAFRVKIDLDKNGIFIGNTFVEFLSEWEVKKMQKEFGIEVDQILQNKPDPTTEQKSEKLPPLNNPVANSSIQSNSLTPDQTQKVDILVDMGFDKSSALKALQQCNWNVDMAAGILF